MSDGKFLFSWCMDGVEAIIDITPYEESEKKATWDILQDNKVERNPLTSILQNIIMRARLNSQRHYEVYAVTCDSRMTEADWEELWEENPQGVADMVRENGVQLYSDRAPQGKVVVRAHH